MMQKSKLGKSNFGGSGLGLGWTNELWLRCVWRKAGCEHCMNSRVHKILLLAALFTLSVAAQAQTDKKAGGAATEWLSYGGDKASSKYSPLAQIGWDNFSRLRVAWTWRSADEEVAKANPHLKTWVWEA